MLPICVRPARVWPKLSSIQGIRANLVYIVSLIDSFIFQTLIVDNQVILLQDFPKSQLCNNWVILRYFPQKQSFANTKVTT